MSVILPGVNTHTNSKSLTTNINIAEVVGKGYKGFWNAKQRYRAVKGGRGSKKSCTAALWYIYNMMKYYHTYDVKPNVLVIRRFFNTHRDSTFAQLKWAVNKLGVKHLWKATVSPMELTYKPSGQKILFRGMDDPQSITSITVEDGELCWVWWEEAFQITDEEAFNKVDLSIRGDMPAPLFKQHTLTFNPWSEKIWLKKRFFDEWSPNVFSDTTTYLDNEFLGEDDIALFEEMKERNPRRYAIEGLGGWGIAQGLVYENWIEQEFEWKTLIQETDKRDHLLYTALFGLDFGFTNDPSAFIGLLANHKAKTIHIFDEHYQRQMVNSDIVKVIKYKGFEKEIITADSSEPKSIEEIRRGGITRIRAALKGPDSVRAGIQKLQDYKIIVHPRCCNAIVELSNYVWEVKDGITLNKPIDDYNHLMDAMRYATEKLGGNNFSFD